MRFTPFAILAAVAGLIFGQEAPSTLNPLIQGGSFAVLAYVIFHLLKFTIPSLQKQLDESRREFTATLDKMADRHDQWEKTRHKDSEMLNSTLTAILRHDVEES